MSQSPSEVPDLNPTPNRSSIDLSMELERQLESEAEVQLSKEQRNSLDPIILAHIVVQLRESIKELEGEKDDLVKQLTESHSRIAEFKETIALLTERCTTLGSDLETAQKKNKDDEEAISMLRSKGKAHVCST